MFCGDAASNRAFARATFSESLSGSGLNCRQAMSMLRGQMDGEMVKLWSWKDLQPKIKLPLYSLHDTLDVYNESLAGTLCSIHSHRQVCQS